MAAGDRPATRADGLQAGGCGGGAGYLLWAAPAALMGSVQGAPPAG